MDVSFVKLDEAVNEPWIWTTLMFGNRRDAYFIKRLLTKNNVGELENKREAETRQGIIVGDKARIAYKKRILDTNDFPQSTFLTIAEEKLPVVDELKYHSKDSPISESFKYPQMFIKHAHQRKTRRFAAAFVESKSRNEVLCSRDFLHLHSGTSFLKSATLTYNSSFAAYYLLLTDGSFAFYHPKPLVDSFWQIPIPDISEKVFNELRSLGEKDREEALVKIDEVVLNSLGVSESEKILVKDLFEFTMRDYFAGREISIGRQATSRKPETELRNYCKTFFKVINAGFGKDKNLRATIFQEKENELPVRMIAIHLNYPERKELIRVDEYPNEKLWELLQKLDKTFMQNESENGNIFYQRVVRVYSNEDGIPTIYLIKPDQSVIGYALKHLTMQMKFLRILFPGFRTKIIHEEQKEKKLNRNFQKTQRQDISALNLSADWNEGWKICVFEVIWQAYDKLMQFYKDNGKSAKNEIENQITSDLIIKANDVKYDVLEGYSTAEYRKLQFHNQPPDEKKSNDIGIFFGINNDKPEFIFEAKKISTLTQKGIEPYKGDLESFLDGYYIPHLSESALIAYLHKGTTSQVFELIKASIKTKLKQFSKFASRPHQMSEHKKTSSNSSQKDFLCHHLVFEML